MPIQKALVRTFSRNSRRATSTVLSSIRLAPDGAHEDLVQGRLAKIEPTHPELAHTCSRMLCGSTPSSR